MSLPGGPELLIIAAVFVLLFGAKKLPELGSSVGKSIKNFKRGIEEAKDDDEHAEADKQADKEADENADEKQVNSTS
jgi:sec-independent protein translocase protein TatA